MKKHKHILILCTAAALAGCATSSPIGLVDMQRIVANWPEYQGYQNQLYADERAIQWRRESTPPQAA